MNTTFRSLWSYICMVFGRLSFNINVSYIYAMFIKPLIQSPLYDLYWNNTIRKVLLSSPFHRKGDTGTKKWKDLAKISLVTKQPGFSSSKPTCILSHFVTLLLMSLPSLTMLSSVFLRGPWGITSRCTTTSNTYCFLFCRRFSWKLGIKLCLYPHVV